MREKRTMFAEYQDPARTSMAGTVILCLLYSSGMLLSLFQLIPFQPGYRIAFWLVSWSILLAGGCFGRFMKQYRKWAVLFPAGSACLGTLYFGPARLFAGAQAFGNVLITRWNLRWNDGIPLYGNGQMQEETLAAFAFCMLMLLTAVFWYLVWKRACVRILVLIFLSLLPEMILRYSSSFGSMMLLTCAAGIWLLSFQAGSRSRRLQWLAAFASVLTLIAAFSGQRRIQAVLEFQEKALRTVEHLRYGEDLLPEGDLKRAWQMQNGESETLLVSTGQVKSLYLTGFVGADYENARWSPLPRAAYGKQRWGFLNWLKENSFDVNSQYAAYEAAGEAGQKEQDPGSVPENHIKVENRGANRKYIYTVYSASAPQGEQITSSRDNGYHSGALLGNWVYEYSERSVDIPGELIQLGDWVYQPQTVEQERYLQGEMVYRDFVYAYYLDIPEQLDAKLQQLFHEGETTESAQAADQAVKKGIYGITQDIRSVMENHFYYRAVPEPSGQNDPLSAFLDGNSYGNSSFYASAGVLALRSFGIPARYAEGYYLAREAIEQNENGTVQLTEKDAHAWAEAYMDGIGWIPVDFTPGFYYNTYALLRMAELPQNIRKTAALEEQGDEAENVTGNTPQDGNVDSESIPDPKITAELAWGIVLAFLFALEVLFAVLELFRWRYEQKIRGPLPEEAEMAAGFLACAIAQNLRVCGIDLRPGWNTEQTENEICSAFPEIPAGFYPRVNETLEKYVYGGAALMPQELRLLQRFLTALRDSRKQLGPRQRIALRYIGVLHGKDTLRHSNQI